MQVMAKRRVGSQIGNLIPNHLKPKIAPISLRAGAIAHTIGKLSMRAITFLWTSFQSEVCTQSYEPPKLQETQL
jgi:hypothetical protein